MPVRSDEWWDGFGDDYEDDYDDDAAGGASASDASPSGALCALDSAAAELRQVRLGSSESEEARDASRTPASPSDERIAHSPASAGPSDDGPLQDETPPVPISPSAPPPTPPGPPPRKRQCAAPGSPAVASAATLPPPRALGTPGDGAGGSESNRLLARIERLLGARYVYSIGNDLAAPALATHAHRPATPRTQPPHITAHRHEQTLHTFHQMPW